MVVLLHRVAVLVWTMLPSLSPVSIDHEITIELLVKIPAETPPDAAIFLAGNLPVLGEWRPDGIKLQRTHDGRYLGTFRAEAGTWAEFKFTRGSWSTVEKRHDGRELPNRRLRLSENGRHELKIAAWAETATPRVRSSRTGTILFHRDFKARRLGNTRDLTVYLPPGYNDQAESGRKYPVLYMQDGQNLFDEQTSAFGMEWRVDETAEQLIRDRAIEPIIVVGIDNTPDRVAEYTPWKDQRTGAGGKGDLYADFLALEVKPFIDQTYRTLVDRAHTGVAGSSLGGLIALHVVARHHEKFGCCAALSPSLWWDGERLLRDLEAKGPTWPRSVRFWIDMGTHEVGDLERSKLGVERVLRLEKLLRAAGLRPGRDLRCLIVPDATHDESQWAERFDQVLLFLHGRNESP